MKIIIPEEIIRKLENLYLSSMPGKYYSISDWEKFINRVGIKKIVCLVSDTEIEMKSPSYYDWKYSQTEYDIIQIPIDDFGVPLDENASKFWQIAESVAIDNKENVPVFIHCAGGVGRTGMFAIAVLMMRTNFDHAKRLVEEVRSGPETIEQEKFLLAKKEI